MKLEEFLIEATFTPKNFPGDINPTFNGAGERTDYINSDQYNQTEGFALVKNVNTVNPVPGYEVLEKGEKVFITRPGKLIRGEDLGAKPRVGVFVAVGIQSADDIDSIGYVPISSIQKPSGAKQSRVAMGSSAQDEILKELQKQFGEAQVEYVSSAPPGSTKPDLIVKINGQPIQFEIKGTSRINAPVTFFDKSARRGINVPLLDELARAYTGDQTFTAMVDRFRETNQQVGFPGDPGVGKSGKLPRELISTNGVITDNVRSVILRHLIESGDDYFVIYDRTKGDVHIYHTGRSKNTLLSPALPPFKKAALQTYGGPSQGAMRVGLKVQLQR